MDSYYYHTASLLHRLNPLNKLLMTTPLLVFIALSSDPWTPVTFALLTILMLLFLGRIPLLHLVKVTLLPTLFLSSFLLIYPFLVRPELVADSPILLRFGPFVYYRDALLFGAYTALRAYAIILISISFTLTTEISDFIRALVQQWKFPYKIAYGAMAAFRFVPMLQTEMRLIQAAHKIRGISDRRDLFYTRIRRYAIPLFAIALRRAERTALAMDSRAFGAMGRRTYYKRYRFSLHDYLFLAGFWLVNLLIIWLFWYLGLLGPLSFDKPL